jgi:unsaturated chondroitin disaccharide hydrolase
METLKKTAIPRRAGYLPTVDAPPPSPFEMTPATATPTESRTAQIRRTFELCVAKSRVNIAAMAKRPTSWAFAVDGDYSKWDEGFFEIGNWTSGFITGMAIIAMQETADESLLKPLESLEPMFRAKLEGVNAVNTMHDLGFLYSPYAVALYQATGSVGYRDLALKAADVLSKRFIPGGGYFRAWGRMDEIGTDYDGLAIIDCLMNMPLLYWASEESGDPKFREMAVRHTETTLAHFVREDGSVFHSYRFDPTTGAPLGGDNYCGRGVDSHWARGATWAMYGFALGYRHTGDERFLDASLRISRKFISLLDEEVVPMWDFRLDEIGPHIRDASAASIAVCALQQLEKLGKADKAMTDAKDALLGRICSDDYLETSMLVHGIQRKGEVGDGVGKAKYAFTSWGDYYLMEGVARELGHNIPWW